MHDEPVPLSDFFATIRLADAPLDRVVGVYERFYRKVGSRTSRSTGWAAARNWLSPPRSGANRWALAEHAGWTALVSNGHSTNGAMLASRLPVRCVFADWYRDSRCFEVWEEGERRRVVLVQDAGGHWTFYAEGEPLAYERPEQYGSRSRRARLRRREVVRLVTATVGFAPRWDRFEHFVLFERSSARQQEAPRQYAFVDDWDGHVPESDRRPSAARPPGLERLVAWVDRVGADRGQETLVPFRVFLDGNDDDASFDADIGQARKVLDQLERRADVGAVLVELYDYDPETTRWPRAEKIHVIGALFENDVRNALASLEPDDVWRDELGRITAWWDD